MKRSKTTNFNCRHDKRQNFDETFEQQRSWWAFEQQQSQFVYNKNSTQNITSFTANGFTHKWCKSHVEAM